MLTCHIRYIFQCTRLAINSFTSYQYDYPINLSIVVPPGGNPPKVFLITNKKKVIAYEHVLKRKNNKSGSGTSKIQCPAYVIDDFLT